jgi:hypothetical protein
MPKREDSIDSKFPEPLRHEDPQRILYFRRKLENFSWDKDNLSASLGKLFEAVDDLAVAEVKYYYRRRGTRAWISGIARTCGWAFGTIGVLCPLLAATEYSAFADWGDLGYIFLALAASCLGANSLFGGTQGHIRFVSTQLEIEQLITQARITWYEYLASQKADTPDIQSGFELIKTYANNLHNITIEETGRWGKNILEALDKFQKKIEENQGKGK